MSSGATDIVLNFEKSRWFDLLPLAQLLALVVSRCDQTVTIHIVGPCTTTLPYMHDHVVRLRKRLDLTVDPLVQNLLDRQIVRHSLEWPTLRRKAGAFLIGWGFFDAVEDHHSLCRWYAVRDKTVSLRSLKDHYGFSYGAGQADRVRPLTVVMREDQHHTINRLNSEELIAGALSKYAGLQIFRSGAAANILFFEPFENVFQHAFDPPGMRDAAVVAMRILPASVIAPGRPGAVQTAFLEANSDKDIMEIVVADAGRGIVATLGDDVPIEAPDVDPNGPRRLAWRSIRYAFDQSSTRKRPKPLGVRGLAWLRDHLLAVRGYSSIRSDGALYELGFGKSATIENDPPAGDNSLRDITVPGVGVQLLFPLTSITQVDLDSERYLRWRSPPPQAAFFEPARERLGVVRIPPPLLMSDNAESWRTFLSAADRRQPNGLIAFDLAQQHATRTALEVFLTEFIALTAIRSRSLILNCHRHNASRLPTIIAIELLQQQRVLLPLFTPTFRTVFLGATEEEELSLLRLLNGQTVDFASVKDLASENRPLFAWTAGRLAGMNFTVGTLEEATRRSLGEELVEILDREGRLYSGRFALPFDPTKSTSLFIEPHRLFANGDIARRICEHLALLVRRRYARDGRSVADLAILTATRIGRELAVRMPDAFPRTGFVFFDHYRVRPDKPRLVNPLIKQQYAVIIVDIISTGGQVEHLVSMCTIAGTKVLAILSIGDFSDVANVPVRHFEQHGKPIEHLTFWRFPQQITESQHGDESVDPETLTLKRVSLREDENASTLAELAPIEGLRYLENADAVVAGHYELFGRHFDFVADVGRLTRESSPIRGEVLRACEKAIIRSDGLPVAFVLYPDLSHTHVLVAHLERQPRIQLALREERFMMIEARRAIRARGRRLWLTDREIDDALRWARTRYPEGYAVTILDEVASSGQTLLALMELAREFEPKELHSYVVVNRMTHVQTRHLVEIERFKWAETTFQSLIHLNIQGYSVETCPVCRERRELHRDAREARELWFRTALQRRLERMEVKMDVDEPSANLEMAGLVEPPIIFGWERPPLRRRRRTALSYILSARVAVNDGVPVKEVLAAADQDAFIVWREVIRDIARRPELLQAQQVEDYVTDVLVKTLRDHTYTPRRVAAMEIIRSLRREAVLPRLSDIVAAALRRILDPEMKTELALLIKRFLDYRHGTANDKFERTATIEHLFEQAVDDAENPSLARSETLAELRREFGERLVDPEKDLTRMIRHLESYIRATGNEHHQFINVIRGYVADRRFELNTNMKSQIDTAVVVTFVAGKLVTTLESEGLLKDETLPEAASKAYTDAKHLRSMIIGRQYGATDYSPRDIQEKMDTLIQFLNQIQPELAGQLVDAGEAVEKVVVGLRESFKASGLKADIQLSLDVGIGLAIVDTTIFGKILRDLLENLGGHARDVDGRVAAVVSLRRSQSDDSFIELTIACTTREAPQGSEAGTTLQQHAKQAEIYDVKRAVDPACMQNPTVPWRETWTFRGL